MKSQNTINLRIIIEATFNAIAQVTFIENWMYGAVVILCILTMNVVCGISIIVSVVFTNIISLKLYGKKRTKTGIPAFNSVILFLLISLFFGGVSNVMLIFPITLGCITLYHVLTNLLKKIDLSAFALPAIFMTYFLFLIRYLFPYFFLLENTQTVIHELTSTFASGLLKHFVINVGDVYLQYNMLFSIILIICFVFIQKDYLLYICSSFIIAYAFYFSLSLFVDVDLTTFSTFNIILGMMCARSLGFLIKDKLLLLKLIYLTISIIFVELCLNSILSYFGLTAMTLPFMIVCYLINIWQNYKSKKEISVITE